MADTTPKTAAGAVATPELRIDESDGNPYPLSSFLEVYGSVQGNLIWNSAPQYSQTATGNSEASAADQSANPAKKPRIEPDSLDETKSALLQSIAEPTSTDVPEKVKQTSYESLLERFGASDGSDAHQESGDNQIRVTQKAVFGSTTPVGETSHALRTPGVCLGPATAPISNNFVRSVKVSPDGLCVLTNSEDTTLRLFNLFPDPRSDSSEGNDAVAESAGKSPGERPWHPVLQMHEGGMIYDMDWYPLMNSNDPVTCAFISTSRGHTLHLWDAYTGKLRTSYRAYDHLDEITSAFSVKFSVGGDKILAGYDRCIRVFDVGRPGMPFDTWATSKSRKSRQGQRGILSCMDSNPNRGGTFAVGSYESSVCIYEEQRGRVLHTFKAHNGGVTQVKFSSDGRYLYSGARKDALIHSWDLRFPRKPVASYRRHAFTNQRISFDLSGDGSLLVSGNSTPEISFYKTSQSPNSAKPDRNSKESAPPAFTVGGFADAANSVCFNPLVNNSFLVGTGQRHFELSTDVDDWSDDSDDEKSETILETAPPVSRCHANIVTATPKTRNSVVVLAVGNSMAL